MLRVLLICPKIPFPPKDGGSIASYAAATGLLAVGAHVSILAVNPSRDEVKLDKIGEGFAELTNLVAVPVDTRIKPLPASLNLFRKSSYILERFKSKAFEKKLIAILNSHKFDVIQIEHLQMCIYIDLIRQHTKTPIVFRPQNVEFQVWKHYLKNLKNPFQRLFLQIAVNRIEKFEKLIPTKVDGIIAISPNDAAAFRKFGDKVPISFVPVGFNFDKLQTFDMDRQFHIFPSVYHLGSMDWRPNVEAIHWFMDELMPLFTKQFPEVKFYLAGKKMPKEFFKHPFENLSVEGTVPDAIKYQEDKAILIVPLLSGSGIRAKIIEAMALGKTVISTTMGLQGMDAKPGKEVLLADTPQEFVDQLKKCVASQALCREMGKAAQKFALANYNYISCATDMLEFYRNLG